MSDDLIKRSDAIKALGEEPYVWKDDDEFAQGERSQWIDDVSAIKAVPSADLNAEFAEWAKLWFKKELEANRPSNPHDITYINALKNRIKELEADRSTIATKQIKYFDEDEKVWKIGSVIVKVPSADRPQGEWIEHHKPFTWMGFAYWTCSECGYGENNQNWIQSNFCPNCGADMRGENNETDKEMR